MRPRVKRKGGGVAQLGERLLCKQEVIGSIPIFSTLEFFDILVEKIYKQLRVTGGCLGS